MPFGMIAPEHAARGRMVRDQIAGRGIRDPAVLAAMERVPRHRFVPEALRESAHADGPLEIGLGQTISQPYIVALMTECLRPRRDMRVLEVGTGSGYQTAVLAECVGEVRSIEILPDLSRRAAVLLDALGYRNVELRVGDGRAGWPEAAPFDGILVTAAPSSIPPALEEQLAEGGTLVIPVGRDHQELVVVHRAAAGLQTRRVCGVRFVPMTGGA